MMLKARYSGFSMSRWETSLRLTGVGFYVGACIVGGTLAGLWLDGKLGTRPLFLIGGLLLGVVVAFYGLYRMLKPLMNDKQDRGNG
jgi:ATP synthase protein I